MFDPRASRARGLLRLGALAGAALAIGAALAVAPASTGCQTHACDQSFSDFLPRAAADGGSADGGDGDGASLGGFMESPYLFVTSGMDETWMSFPPNAIVHVWFPPEAAGLMPSLPPVGWVATGPTPNAADASSMGVNYVNASGQLAEYNDLYTFPVPTTNDAGVLVGGGFTVTNGTCADYHALFTVTFLPPDAATPAVPDDAGASE